MTLARRPILTTSLIASAVFTLFSSTQAWAEWLSDYSGTLGEQRIGMMIESAGVMSRPEQEFARVHYYYVRHLKNIPLKTIKREGRHFILEEADESGKPVARFQLEFPEYDLFNHYSHAGPGPVKLGADEIIGSWEPLNGGPRLRVVLFMADAVTGSNGGRCDLTAAKYQHVENRAKSFYQAAVKNDQARLQREFHFKMPEGKIFRRYLAESVPHDMFCHNGLFLLGNGWVSFDVDGNPH